MRIYERVHRIGKRYSKIDEAKTDTAKIDKATRFRN
jgi:hypothetical protein